MAINSRADKQQQIMLPTEFNHNENDEKHQMTHKCKPFELHSY